MILYTVIQVDGCVTMNVWLGYFGSLASMIFFSVLIRENILDPPRFRSQPQLSVRRIVFHWWFGMGKEETPEMEIVVCYIIHFQDCIEILDHSGMYMWLCVCMFFGLEQRMFFCCTWDIVPTESHRYIRYVCCHDWYPQLFPVICTVGDVMKWSHPINYFGIQNHIQHYIYKKNRIQRSIWPTKKFWFLDLQHRILLPSTIQILKLTLK